MKKVLKICSVAVLALVMVFGMFTAAFAAGSATDIVEFWAGDTRVDQAGTEAPEEGTAATLAKESSMTKFWAGEIPSDYEGQALVCKIQGAKDGDAFFVFHKGSDWTFVGKYTTKDGQFDITFDDLSPVAIFKASAPKTGDANNMLLWGGLMVAAAAAAVGTVVYSKKRRTEA